MVPVVFLHGAGARGQLWQNQLLDIPGALAPDLPGHPDGEALSSVEALVSWLIGWLDDRAITRAVLVGHSLGGALALSAAIHVPDRVAALGLLATGARLPDDAALWEEAARDPGAAADRMAAASHGPRATAAMITRTRRALAVIPPAVLRADLRACAGFDALLSLPSLRVPALVACGEADRMTPPAWSRALARAIAGARLALWPDIGHLLMIEAREQLRRALRPFVAEIRGGP